MVLGNCGKSCQVAVSEKCDFRLLCVCEKCDVRLLCVKSVMSGYNETYQATVCEMCDVRLQ